MVKDFEQWNEEMVRKYHKEGTLFESKNPLLRWAEKERLKEMLKAAKLKKEDAVLDLGCGEGFLLKMMPRTRIMAGIDLSETALQKAGQVLKNKPYIKLIKRNAENTKMKKESFDKIFCSEVLEHVPEPRKVVKEIHRILKKDGTAVISIPDEKRIQQIMRMTKLLMLNKIIRTLRKKEKYEWHLHNADLNFVKKNIEGYFRITAIKKVPRIVRHRFVVTLRKIYRK